MKLKCVKYNNPDVSIITGENNPAFTIGKIYDYENGKIRSDFGFTYFGSDDTDVIDFLSEWYEFEEVSENQTGIKKVIFNNPATIVFWEDGTKTTVICGEDDTFDMEKGLAMAIIKKTYTGSGNYMTQIKKLIKEAKIVKPKKEKKHDD